MALSRLATPARGLADVAPFFVDAVAGRGGNGPHVAREPTVGRGVVRAQEAALGFGQAQQAGHGGVALGLGGGARRALARLGRHEAAVDEHDAAVGGAQRRQHPEAGAEPGAGLHQRFLVMEERAAKAHVSVFVVGRVDRGPFGARRRVGGRGVHALVDAGDEIELPGPALDLPGAERKKAGKGQEDADRQRRTRDNGARAGGRGHQGMFFMSWTMAGIMLVFM